MEERAERLFREREKRFDDILALRVPDRVPIMVSWGFLPAFRAGMTVQEVMYDPEKLWTSQWDLTLEFQPDMEQNPKTRRGDGNLCRESDRLHSPAQGG